MIADLRREADNAAREAMRDMVAYMVKHGGRRNPTLEDTYRAAERVVDAVEELERYAATSTQAADDEAPDFFLVYAEGDLRADWGNR